MLTLTAEEQIWLEQYRQALQERFPGLVQDIIIFGSKARGDAREDSDLDMMVIINEGNRKLKDTIADLGNELAIGTNCVPFILVYTQSEREQRIKNESVFMEIVNQEGISV